MATRPLARSALFLISSHEVCLTENVAFHCRFERGFGRAPQVRQQDVERIELVEIPMPPGRRAGAPITKLLPVIEPGLGARWQFSRVDSLSEGS